MESAFARPLPIGATAVDAVPSNPPICGSSSSLISLASSTISAGSSSTAISSSLLLTPPSEFCCCLVEIIFPVWDISFLRASFRSSCSFRARRARVNSRVSFASKVIPPSLVDISVSLFCTVRAVCNACTIASAAPPLVVFTAVALPLAPDISFSLRKRRALANAALRNASSGSSSISVVDVVVVVSLNAVAVRKFPFAMIFSNLARLEASSGSFCIAVITSSFSSAATAFLLLSSLLRCSSFSSSSLSDRRRFRFVPPFDE
mmetsp:Transcript_22244/g.31240  ORF Transcript_22244/g.31240 Transcript_22244/m.31240 type:complete len:262 (-) Transcript_22244:20-805(-)